MHWEWLIYVFLVYIVSVTATDELTENDLFIKCPSLEWYSFGHSCYYVLRSEDSYFKSVKSCEDIDKRAHLVNFNKVEEYYRIYHVISRGMNRNIGTWIGLTRHTDGWQWSDGTMMTDIELWLNDEPQQGGCAYIPGHKVGFATSFCDQEMGALCEITMDIDDMYDANHNVQMQIMKNVLIVSSVLAIVLAVSVALAAICVGKYCRNRDMASKGYKKQLQDEAWM